jgi:glycosyltransferase involved in cell wall biosynthesis
MNIVKISPGAGGMYCGGCFRDNALVAAWRKLGHDAMLLPLYLPMTLDEENQAQDMPIFFGGINVYLQQKSALFGKLPGWLHRLLDSPGLLNRAAGSAAKTRPQDLGELAVSMLQGEEGRQRRELDELLHWLKYNVRPDVICLSNALLLGMARRLKEVLHVPIVCLLAGEDSFIDALPEPHRVQSWAAARDRAREVNGFSATSRYYGELMRQRLELPPERVHVVYTGINLQGYEPADRPPQPPVLGYFARMCKEKGLPTLVEAFVALKKRGRVPDLKLKVGGGLSPTDEKVVVQPLRRCLQEAGLAGEVEFCPNLTRDQKLEFYRSVSVLSVPALYGEAFGLYLVEAWASGVPVVQPRHASFPELIELTRAGVVCEPGDAMGLAKAIEELLLDPDRQRGLGQAGRAAAVELFSIERMAERMVDLFRSLPPHAPKARQMAQPLAPR